MKLNYKKGRKEIKDIKLYKESDSVYTLVLDLPYLAYNVIFYESGGDDYTNLHFEYEFNEMDLGVLELPFANFYTMVNKSKNTLIMKIFLNKEEMYSYVNKEPVYSYTGEQDDS
jgi:hypothetical protein